MLTNLYVLIIIILIVQTVLCRNLNEPSNFKESKRSGSLLFGKQDSSSRYVDSNNGINSKEALPLNGEFKKNTFSEHYELGKDGVVKFSANSDKFHEFGKGGDSRFSGNSDEYREFGKDGDSRFSVNSVKYHEFAKDGDSMSAGNSDKYREFGKVADSKFSENSEKYHEFGRDGYSTISANSDIYNTFGKDGDNMFSGNTDKFHEFGKGGDSRFSINSEKYYEFGKDGDGKFPENGYQYFESGKDGEASVNKKKRWLLADAQFLKRSSTKNSIIPLRNNNSYLETHPAKLQSVKNEEPKKNALINFLNNPLHYSEANFVNEHTDFNLEHNNIPLGSNPYKSDTAQDSLKHLRELSPQKSEGDDLKRSSSTKQNNNDQPSEYRIHDEDDLKQSPSTKLKKNNDQSSENSSHDTRMSIKLKNNDRSSEIRSERSFSKDRGNHLEIILKSEGNHPANPYLLQSTKNEDQKIIENVVKHEINPFVNSEKLEDSLLRKSEEQINEDNKLKHEELVTLEGKQKKEITSIDAKHEAKVELKNEDRLPGNSEDKSNGDVRFKVEENSEVVKRDVNLFDTSKEKCKLEESLSSKPEEQTNNVVDKLKHEELETSESKQKKEISGIDAKHEGKDELKNEERLSGNSENKSTKDVRFKNEENSKAVEHNVNLFDIPEEKYKLEESLLSKPEEQINNVDDKLRHEELKTSEAKQKKELFGIDAKHDDKDELKNVERLSGNSEDNLNKDVGFKENSKAEQKIEFVKKLKSFENEAKLHSHLNSNNAKFTNEDIFFGNSKAGVNKQNKIFRNSEIKDQSSGIHQKNEADINNEDKIFGNTNAALRNELNSFENSVIKDKSSNIYQTNEANLNNEDKIVDNADVALINEENSEADLNKADKSFDKAAVALTNEDNTFVNSEIIGKPSGLFEFHQINEAEIKNEDKKFSNDDSDVFRSPEVKLKREGKYIIEITEKGKSFAIPEAKLSDEKKPNDNADSGITNEVNFLGISKNNLNNERKMHEKCFCKLTNEGKGFGNPKLSKEDSIDFKPTNVRDVREGKHKENGEYKKFVKIETKLKNEDKIRVKQAVIRKVIKEKSLQNGKGNSQVNLKFIGNKDEDKFLKNVENKSVGNREDKSSENKDDKSVRNKEYKSIGNKGDKSIENKENKSVENEEESIENKEDKSVENKEDKLVENKEYDCNCKLKLHKDKFVESKRQNTDGKLNVFGSINKDSFVEDQNNFSSGKLNVVTNINEGNNDNFDDKLNLGNINMMHEANKDNYEDKLNGFRNVNEGKSVESNKGNNDGKQNVVKNLNDFKHIEDKENISDGNLNFIKHLSSDKFIKNKKGNFDGKLSFIKNINEDKSFGNEKFNFEREKQAEKENSDAKQNIRNVNEEKSLGNKKDNSDKKINVVDNRNEDKYVKKKEAKSDEKQTVIRQISKDEKQTVIRQISKDKSDGNKENASIKKKDANEFKSIAKPQVKQKNKDFENFEAKVRSDQNSDNTKIPDTKIIGEKSEGLKQESKSLVEKFQNSENDSESKIHLENTKNKHSLILKVAPSAKFKNHHYLISNKWFFKNSRKKRSMSRKQDENKARLKSEEENKFSDRLKDLGRKRRSLSKNLRNELFGSTAKKPSTMNEEDEYFVKTPLGYDNNFRVSKNRPSLISNFENWKDSKRSSERKRKDKKHLSSKSILKNEDSHWENGEGYKRALDNSNNLDRFFVKGYSQKLDAFSKKLNEGNLNNVFQNNNENLMEGFDAKRNDNSDDFNGNKLKGKRSMIYSKGINEMTHTKNKNIENHLRSNDVDDLKTENKEFDGNTKSSDVNFQDGKSKQAISSLKADTKRFDNPVLKRSVLKDNKLSDEPVLKEPNDKNVFDFSALKRSLLKTPFSQTPESKLKTGHFDSSDFVKHPSLRSDRHFSNTGVKSKVDSLDNANSKRSLLRNDERYFENVVEAVSPTPPVKKTAIFSESRVTKPERNYQEIKVLLGKLLEEITEMEKKKREDLKVHTHKEHHASSERSAMKPTGKKKKKDENRKTRWGHWTDWSSCSVSCGKGRQIRWRHCIEHCEDAETEMEEKTCQLPACGPGKLFGMIKL